MRSTLVLLLPLILFATIGCATQKSTPSQRAVITGDVLRVRSEPSLKSETLTSLSRGTIVDVLDKSATTENIADTEAYWYKIKSENLTGWCFGAFLTTEFEESPDKKILTWLMDTKDNYNIIKRAIFLTQQKKLHIIEYEVMSKQSAFSESYKYLAVDNGTDVLGTLDFYDVYTGKLLQSATYPRHDFKWEGEQLKFQNVTYSGNGCYLWREDTFNDGKIRKGTLTGKGDSNLIGDQKDPKCH